MCHLLCWKPSDMNLVWTGHGQYDAVAAVNYHSFVFVPMETVVS